MSDVRDKQREELVEAFDNGDKDKVVTLLKNTEKPGEMRGSANWTLLHYAAMCGMTDVCQLLIEQYQVDLHVKDSIDGLTALHCACVNNHTDTVKYLVSHAHCDPLIKDNYGYTPLSKSEGETRHFLQDIIDQSKKEGFTSVPDYTKAMMSQERQSVFDEGMAEGGGDLSPPLDMFNSHTPNIMERIPNDIKSDQLVLRDVFNVFKDKAYDWNSIGRELNVPLGYREDLRMEGVQTSSEYKLERVLNKWMESECSPVSWHGVVKVIKDLKYNEPLGLEDILSRGNENEAVIAAALAEGKGNLSQSTIILHGPPGAGKSSLKRLILGLDPPTKEEQNSTDIMEKGVRAVSIDKMNEFRIIENKKLIDMLASEVNNHHQMKVAEPMTKPVGIFEHEVDLNSRDNFVPNITDSTKASSIVSIIERLDQATGPIKIYDTRWHHVVDSGGQPQFLDILPLVYRTPPSINIVVIRLTDGLDDKQEVRFYEEGKNIYTLPDHLSLTNREFIINVCQIASSTEGSVKPRVMIVGTHFDKLGNSAVEKLKKFNDSLSKVQKEFSTVLICKGKDSIIFPVNTMAKEAEREKHRNVFHDCITKVTSNVTPHIEVPLRWLVYELEIDKDEGVMSVHDCEEKGEPLGMKPDDVKNALTFLNKSALLLYYPDEDLVLTKMDPLVGQLSALIKASFITPDYYPSAEQDKLRTTGLFYKSYLSKVLSNFEDLKLNIDKFLKVLEHLKIIVSVGNDEYFLPSALSLEPANESSLPSDKMASPIVFSLGTNHFLPHGFFFTVAIELLGCDDGEYKFQLCDGAGSDMVQHRNEIHIKEADRKIPGIITLTNRIKWIKVTSSNTVKPQVHCPVIYKKVNDAFNKTLDRFHLPATTVKCSPSTFPCPLCPDCKEEHYCRVTPDKTTITCERSCKTSHVTKEISYWFEGQLVLSQSPDLHDVFNVLRDKVCDWDSIGRELNVPYEPFRKELGMERNTTTNESKLERVLHKWAESKCSAVSWHTVLKVLKTLQYKDLIETVNAKLKR